MIGEDLGYKPSVVEHAKFEYSSLGKVFNKELDKNENCLRGRKILKTRMRSN